MAKETVAHGAEWGGREGPGQGVKTHLFPGQKPPKYYIKNNVGAALWIINLHFDLRNRLTAGMGIRRVIHIKNELKTARGVLYPPLIFFLYFIFCRQWMSLHKWAKIFIFNFRLLDVTKKLKSSKAILANFWHITLFE